MLRRRRPLEEQLSDISAESQFSNLADRDRAFVRALAATVLRRLGTLRHLLRRYLERGLPPNAARVETALLLGAAQVLWLDVPDHAAVDLAVKLARADAAAARYAGLVNAVLRRIVRDGAGDVAQLDRPALDAPDWLPWCSTIGRLKPGVSARQARAELATYDKSLINQFIPAEVQDRLRVRNAYLRVSSARTGLPTFFGQVYSTPLYLMQGLVGIVLLLCCVNVAGLMMSKVHARRQEFALRTAIGAARWRLVSQYLTESFKRGKPSALSIGRRRPARRCSGPSPRAGRAGHTRRRPRGI